MSHKLWSDDMVQYLKEIAPGLYIDEIAERINQKFGTSLTSKQIKNKLQNSNIRIGRVKKNYRSKLLNPEQFEYFKQINKGSSTEKVAEMLNEKYSMSLTPAQIKALKGNAKIPSGRDTSFKKGEVPHNKGVKGKYRRNRTSFKKGMVPHNVLPIGTERISPDGYIIVKVQNHGTYNEQWMFKSRLVWEKEIGPVPKGYQVTYLDGNKQNCDIENLALVSKAERLKINQFGLNFDDPNLNRTGIIIAKLALKESKLRRKG